MPECFNTNLEFSKNKNNKKIFFLMEPVKECNLHCKYCYVGKERRNKRKMSPVIFKDLIQKALLEYKSIKFHWLGGEPLLMPASFYREICKIQKGLDLKGASVVHTMQSNGTLMQEEDFEMLEYFKKENFNFNLSFSFDGPWQNEMRGENTAKIILKNIRRLEKVQGNASVLSMISNKNYNKIKVLFDFFLEKGIKHFLINPIAKIGDAKSMEEEYLLKPGMYAQTVIEALEYQFKDGREEKINCLTLGHFISALLNKKTTVCKLDFCLGDFLAINSEGGIGYCHTFENPYANLREIKFINDAFNSKLFLTHKRMIAQRIAGCKSCKWFKSCLGGCFSNIYQNKEIKYDFCYDHKLIFEKIEKFLIEKLKICKLNKFEENILQEANNSFLRVINFKEKRGEEIFRNQKKETKDRLELLKKLKDRKIISLAGGYYDLTRITEENIGKFLFKLIKQEIINN